MTSYEVKHYSNNKQCRMVMTEDLEIEECSSLSAQVADAGKKRGGGMFQIVLGYFL